MAAGHAQATRAEIPGEQAVLCFKPVDHVVRAVRERLQRHLARERNAVLQIVNEVRSRVGANPFIDPRSAIRVAKGQGYLSAIASAKTDLSANSFSKGGKLDLPARFIPPNLAISIHDQRPID
jgi:hypothetical protein